MRALRSSARWRARRRALRELDVGASAATVVPTRCRGGEGVNATRHFTRRNYRRQSFGEEETNRFGVASTMLVRVYVLGGANIPNGVAGVAVHLRLFNGYERGFGIPQAAEHFGCFSHPVPSPRFLVQILDTGVG